MKIALASGLRLGSNDATNFRGVNSPSLGRLVGMESASESEFTTVQPLLQMLEDGADDDPEELREAMMEAVKEFMEENSENLEGSEDAVNLMLDETKTLGGNLNFTLEPQDAGTNILGELPVPDHFLNHLPLPPPPPPPDTVSQVKFYTLRFHLGVVFLGQVELPPPAPGCRSIATTRCHHHPVVIPR